MPKPTIVLTNGNKQLMHLIWMGCRSEWLKRQPAINSNEIDTHEKRKRQKERTRERERSSAFLLRLLWHAPESVTICQMRTHTSLQFIRNQISHEKILLFVHFFSLCGIACLYLNRRLRCEMGLFRSLCRSRLAVMKYRIERDKHVASHWLQLILFLLFWKKRITASLPHQTPIQSWNRFANFIRTKNDSGR